MSCRHPYPHVVEHRVTDLGARGVRIELALKCCGALRYAQETDVMGFEEACELMRDVAAAAGDPEALALLESFYG